MEIIKGPKSRANTRIECDRIGNVKRDNALADAKAKAQHAKVKRDELEELLKQ